LKRLPLLSQDAFAKSTHTISRRLGVGEVKPGALPRRSDFFSRRIFKEARTTLFDLLRYEIGFIDDISCRVRKSFFGCDVLTWRGYKLIRKDGTEIYMVGGELWGESSRVTRSAIFSVGFWQFDTLGFLVFSSYSFCNADWPSRNTPTLR
jgi:hypothetical protein